MAWAAVASGQVTTYTSQSTFNAALPAGGATNSYPGLPAADFSNPIPAQRYVLGAPYASYAAYVPTGMFFDNYYGGSVPGIGNFQFSQPLYVDFNSNNVRQVGATFFFTDFFGAPQDFPFPVVVNFYDGSSATVPIVTGSVATSTGAAPNFFGISVSNTSAAIRQLVIPRYPNPPGTEVYLNMGPITTAAFGNVAQFWSGAGSATTLGGSGTWSTAGSNWASSGTSIGAWNASRRAVFSGTGGTVAVAAGGVSVAQGIAFDASGIFLEGPGTVTLTGTSAAANDVYVGPSIAPSIVTTLSAASGFTKSGPGSLRVTGTAAGGPITISRGVLQVGNGGTSGAITASGIVNSAELEFNRSDAHSFAGAISGTGALYVTGGGRTTLTGTSTYTGATGILSSGTLAIANAAAVAGSVRVSTGTSGGVFDVSGVAGGYSVPGTQTLTGGGTVLGTTSLGGGATLSPGVGRGTITMSGSLTFGGGGNYNWQADDLSLPAGQTGSYDLVSVLGSLSITASATSTFKINLWSVVPNGSTGPAAGFDPLVSSTYTLLTTTAGISGFASSKFTINTSATNGTAGFTNDLQGGSFRVAQAGNDLNLVFSPAGSSITINVPSGTQTQTAAGYPSLAGSTPVTKTGAGVLVLDQANPLAAPLTVEAGSVRLTNASALSAATLAVLGGGTAQLGSRITTSVAGLELSSGGLVDVTNSSLSFVSGLSVADLVAALVVGRNGGTWDGTSGITSTVTAAQVTAFELRAVGWMDNGDGSKTVAYAAQGDTNLDWVVDILDVSNFVSSGKFGTGEPATWMDGDFNYDGVVDIQDVADFSASGLYGAGSYNSGPGIAAAVPEPPAVATTVLALAAMAGATFQRRRR
ncbi:MAG: hypothetical protein FJ286_07160 [Planctomycetes bacterium]|nr:hypothetical protein [Planctomycetota bacterium]